MSLSLSCPRQRVCKMILAALSVNYVIHLIKLMFSSSACSGLYYSIIYTAPTVPLFTTTIIATLNCTVDNNQTNKQLRVDWSVDCCCCCCCYRPQCAVKPVLGFHFHFHLIQSIFFMYTKPRSFIRGLKLIYILPNLTLNNKSFHQFPWKSETMKAVYKIWFQ